MSKRTGFGPALATVLTCFGSCAAWGACPDLSGTYIGSGTRGEAQLWVVTRDGCRSVKIVQAGDESVYFADSIKHARDGATGKSWYTADALVDETVLTDSLFAMARSTYRLDASRNLVAVVELLNSAGVRQVATSKTLRRKP
jgi:hypothetical protein